VIDHLDNLLRHLFIARIDEITDEAQVRFQPPDEDWRAYVSNLTVGGQPVNALNVYMIDMRENRKLRSNERTRDIQNGTVIETPAPFRLDCHYLITAWSPAQASQAVEPTIDEHALLYKVTAALTNNEPLVPRTVYAPNPLPGTFPEIIADAELPTALLPVEGFPKYAEFWGTMGVNHRWKPAIYLIATLPVVFDLVIAGPMVTTCITEYRVRGIPETAETWIQIAGSVLDSTHPLPTGAPSPVANAWVQLENPAGERLQLTQTDEQGHFTFNKLHFGRYRLRTQGTGQGEITRDIDVPSSSGEYDLQF
jgi:hypothetical protein